MEACLEAVFVMAVRIGPCERLPDGKVAVRHKVRWWNPIAWLAWFRVVVLGDQFGAAYFLSQKQLEARRTRMDKCRTQA